MYCSSNSLSSASLCPICEKPAEKQCQGCQRVSYCSIQHQKEDWKRHRANCSPYVLKTNSELNRYAAASRKLKAGSIILEERPYVYGPRVALPSADSENSLPEHYEKPMICLSCCKQMPGSNICVKCKWPVCGSACAKAKQHSESECKHFTRNRVKFQPNILQPHLLYRGILILRALLKRRDLDDDELWSRIMSLQSERADKSALTGYFLESKSVAVLQSYFKAKDIGDNEDWVRLNGVIDINAFSVDRVEQEHEEPSIATIFFPKSSLLAHSCVPNCTWSVAYSPEFSMRIRASRNIEKGEMITVSYNHNWNYFGNLERRHMISETAGFICNCDRCTDSTELGTHMSSLKCMSALCQGYVLPMTSPASLQLPVANWKCDNPTCESTNQGENFTNPQIQIKSIEREWNEIRATMNAVPMIGTQLIENLIHCYSEHVLHPNHWLLQQASRTLVHIQGGQLKSLDQYQLQNFIKHCRYLLPIANLLTPGISADRGLLLLYLSRALALDYKQTHNSGTDSQKQFEMLKTIQDYQLDAFLYWKDDIQSKPLDEQMGYEASSLHDEILNISALMSTCD